MPRQQYWAKKARLIMCLNQIKFACFSKDEKGLWSKRFVIYFGKLGHQMTQNIFDFHKNLTFPFSS